MDGVLTDLRDVSLGPLCILADDVLLQIFGALDAASLARCAAVSHGMRVLAYTDELWKACLLEELPTTARLRWDRRGWRHSYLLCRHRLAEETSACGNGASARASLANGDRCYYSDVLYAPWQCGTAAIPRAWSRRANIPRVDAASLSVGEFATRFEASGQPVILTGLASSWAASSLWSFEGLRARFGNEAGFHVGGYTMGLADFFDYCETTTDETPLYLFDKQFGGHRGAASTAAMEGGPGHGQSTAAVSPPPSGGLAATTLAEEYHVPPYFAAERDLFAALPEAYRPDHRWLIIGGTRSGSSWHVDPNATSAWNACIRGRKKWILTPPQTPPPGVTASDDGSSVTSPISLYEWFRVFYSSLSEVGHALEATVHEGEVLYVPAGWWHCCLNLEPSIAVTQNYAPAAHARSILTYLRAGEKCGELVSGVPTPLRPHLHERFAEVLAKRQPDALSDGPPAESAACTTAGRVQTATAKPAAPLAGVRPTAEAPVEFRFSFD